MANSTGGGGGEHRVWLPAHCAGQAGKAAAALEMWLNRFVLAVALIERIGNALGTLAFTWATVVLLGGYSKDLSLEDDFWYATAIVFLEATSYTCAIAALRSQAPDDDRDDELFVHTGARSSSGFYPPPTPSRLHEDLRRRRHGLSIAIATLRTPLESRFCCAYVIASSVHLFRTTTTYTGSKTKGK